MMRSSQTSIDEPEKETTNPITGAEYVQLQREIYRLKNEERQKRRNELQNEIYQEASCIDKLKINARSFFAWLLYNE
jgi:hypothetical protein